MPDINISSFTLYYNSQTTTASNSGSGTADSPNLALLRAKSDAASGLGNPSTPNPPNGGTSSTTKKFGMSLGAISSISYTNTSISPLPADDGYLASCTASRSRTGTAYQLKLSFTLPSGITSDNIDSAFLVSGCSTGWEDGSYSFSVYAPASTTALSNYLRPSESKVITKKATQTITDSTTSLNINITDAFKLCLDKKLGWITLGRNADSVTSSPVVTLSGTTKITYTLTNTPCGAPTSVSFTSVVKPGGSLTVSWSGATAGTNNSISGYDVYYKIGSAPTTSSYTGTKSVISTATSASTSFTIPSTATRGSAFYAMVRTKGSAGSSYYSDWKSSNGGVVNSLPGAPTVTVDKTRIRSDGTATTINFTVAAGSDNNTSQTKTLYYATSESGTKTPFTSPLSLSLNAATTYYFWTYDGLEYSSSYTSKAITVNTPPSITSVTMSPYNNTTYTPSWESKPFVTNINCSETHTADSAATLTYSWRFATSSTVNGTYTNLSAFGTKTSYTNLDVTAKGVSSFGKFYKLKLRITDDLGEYAEDYAKSNGNDIIYCIPAAPTVSNVYNRKANSNASNTNANHFDTGMRFTYDPTDNNGVTKELLYSTDSDFNTYSTISLSGNDKSDVTLSSLTRGTTYYFRIKVICNSISTIVTITNPGRMRANNITPTNISITPASGDTIKPYTLSTFSFSFQNLPTSWASAQDVATSYNSIYSLKLKYSSRELNITSSGNNSSGTVSGTATINSITTALWLTLLGSTDAPNTSYTITLEITVTNGFSLTFTATENFTVNFIEGIYNIGTPELRIKTGSNIYTKIVLDENNKINNKYPIYEGLILLVALSGIKCYANLEMTVLLMLSDTELGRTTIAATEWNETNSSGTSYRYTLNGSKIINYTVPYSSSSGARDYSIKVTPAKGSAVTTTGGNLLDTCYLIRFTSSAINFKITGINNETTLDWSCTDWGAYASGSKYSTGYSSIKVTSRYAVSLNGLYTEYEQYDDLTSNASSGSGIIHTNLTGVSSDIIYFGSKIELTLDFRKTQNKMPVGNLPAPIFYDSLFIYMRSTPNLVYGKNFFSLNLNLPKTGRTDLILELSRASYENGQNTIYRNKIYFGQGNDDTYFEIADDDGNLIINCGTWNT